MTTIEPQQFAEKSVVIREATQPFYLEGYHRPDYRDPDDSVYDAITDIFSNGRTARLYRSLVRDQKIAPAAEGFSGFPGQKYPGLFVFYAVPLPGHTPDEMRDAIHKELDKLKTEDVTDEELARFKTRTSRPAARPRRQSKASPTNSPIYQTRLRRLARALQRAAEGRRGDQGRHPPRRQQDHSSPATAPAHESNSPLPDAQATDAQDQKPRTGTGGAE